MQETWASIVAAHSSEKIEVMGTFLTQLTTYLLLALFFTPLDFSDPLVLRNYGLRAMTKRVKVSLLRKFGISAFRNQLIAAALHALQLALFQRLALPTPISRVTASIPNFREVFRDIFLCTLGREVLYYYLHRLLHNPRLYFHIHKHHHQFAPPLAIAGHHFHPVDYIITGVLPVVIPAWVLKAHVLTMWLNIILVFTEASVVHCRYNFYEMFDLKPTSHDLHHKYNNVNFGVFGAMDYIHGTNFLGERQSIVRK